MRKNRVVMNAAKEDKKNVIRPGQPHEKHTPTKNRPSHRDPERWAIEAFQAFEWIYDLPADATVPAQQLARFANHVLDVTKGAALVFELIAANEFDSLCDQASYLTPNHLGTLRRLATCSLSSLERHAEEIAEGFRATAEKP